MVRLGRARRYGESVVAMARRHGKVRARAEARCREREYASTCTGSQPTRLRFVASPMAPRRRVWSGRDVGGDRPKSTTFLYIDPFSKHRLFLEIPFSLSLPIAWTQQVVKPGWPSITGHRTCHSGCVARA